jgi:hypothetical protein
MGLRPAIVEDSKTKHLRGTCKCYKALLIGKIPFAP